MGKAKLKPVKDTPEVIEANRALEQIEWYPNLDFAVQAHVSVSAWKEGRSVKYFISMAWYIDGQESQDEPEGSHREEITPDTYCNETLLGNALRTADNYLCRKQA